MESEINIKCVAGGFVVTNTSPGGFMTQVFHTNGGMLKAFRTFLKDNTFVGKVLDEPKT